MLVGLDFFLRKKNSLGMKGFNRKFLVGFLLHEKCGVERYDINTYFLYVCIVCIKCICTFCYISSGPLKLAKWKSDFIVRSMEQQWMHLWSVQLA